MDGLRDVFGEAFGEPETYGGARPPADYQRRLLDDPAFAALVALEDGKVVGGLAAYELQKFEQARSEFYIYDLAVAADHRRRGIATALREQLQQLAAIRGATVVFVQADRDDAPSISLHNKAGQPPVVLPIALRTDSFRE